MRHRFWPLFAVAFCSLQAQTGIQGLVEDPSDRPVEAATVVCGGRRILTSTEGRFTFPDVSRCQAIVTAPGFETVRALFAGGEEIRVRLAIAGVTERMLVSAVRAETTAEEAGVSASIVTRADLQERQNPMIADVLQQLPGVHVARFGRQGAETHVFTRGGQRTGTLVVLDGVPVNDPGGELNFAHLSSADIDRMEVVRGPESALFGADASAGVVQIFTRRGDPERRTPRGSVAYERGNFNSDRWTTNVAGGSGERLDYSLTADQIHTAGEFPNDFYRNTSGSANLGFRLTPSTQLRGSFREFDAIGGSPNAVAYGTYDFDANRESRDSLVSLRVDDARGRNFLQRAIFGYHRLRDRFNDSIDDGPYTVAALVRDTAMPVPRTYLVGLVDPLRPPAVLPDGTRLVTVNTQLYAYPGLSVTSRGNFDYQGTWAQTGGSAVFGYEYERQQGVISGTGVERGNHAVFLHKQQTLAGRISLSGGIRVERNSVFKTKLTPRAAVGIRAFGEHGVFSSTFVRFSAGRGITEPTLLETFARESTYVGNPSLRLEKATSYEVGVIQEWFGRRVRTEFSVFDNRFRDLIAFVFTAPPAMGTWDNIGASRARGGELIVQAKFLRYFRASGSYTRLWTRITDSSVPTSPLTGIGQELLRRPKNSGSVSLSIEPKRWWLQAGAVFMGERQDADMFGVTRNPGYQSVYASGSYRLNPHVSPFFRADNVLNSRYQEVLGYSCLSRTVRGGLRLDW